MGFSVAPRRRATGVYLRVHEDGESSGNTAENSSAKSIPNFSGYQDEQAMQEKINRVRWQCRRGMLELDLLLQSFFDKHYVSLSEVNKALFEQLLEHHDQDL